MWHYKSMNIHCDIKLDILLNMSVLKRGFCMPVGLVYRLCGSRCLNQASSTEFVDVMIDINIFC